MTRVIVLRPEPGATETVRKARECGLDALSMPLFEIEPIPWEVPQTSRFDALLLTSANAVRYGGAGLEGFRGLPTHAVGEATAEIARNAGFLVASVGDRGAEALLATLDPGLRLLHLCGEHRARPASARQEVVPMVVYSSRELPVPDISATQGAVVLIHSPRAGQRFAELIEDRSSTAVAAISTAAAMAAGTGWAAIEAVESPNDDALLALAERLCNTLPPR